MADDASNEASSSMVKAGDDPESTIEINIKTLDSQVYKLCVKKNVSVLVLKEKIVDATGIPVDQQRLIFRGRVLKDDLEDGYTLHLVARRAAEGQHSSGTSEENTHGNVNVVGDRGLLGDISRSVQGILGSLGLGMPGGVTNTTFSVPLTTAPEGANNVNGRTQPGNPPQPGFAILNQQIQVSQLQPAGAIPRNMVIPDSLMTLLEYMNRMDQVLQSNGVPSADSNTQQPPRSDDAYLNQRFPSPDVLVSVIERAQQLLGGSASSALSHLTQRIQNDAATDDASIRSQIQNESAQLGVAMQHLGAMLLELGRTMMMLRMGPSPSDAFVNAGPAVYINSVGPNPIMVQPSFQNTPPFGISSIPVLGGVSGVFGIVDPSRTSGANIHVSGNFATSQSVGTITASGGAVNGYRQNVERTQGGNPSANSTRGSPTRTVILPVQVRSQVAVPNQSTASQPSHTAEGNGSQPNYTFVVPQASLGGVASIPSIRAQVTAHVANALAANPPGQISSSVQSTADQGSHPTTNNGVGTMTSAASASTQLQNALSSPNHGQTSLNVQSHVTGTETSRTTKPSAGGSGDSGEPLNSSSVSKSQEAVSMGQQVMQALVSQSTDVSRSSTTDSSPPSSTPQFAGGMPPRRQGSEGQVDINSMISSVLNNPVFGNLLSNVAAQTGVGSVDDLRNMMEECTQSPAMMDTISNIVQNVDGPGRGQGSIGLSRMMQQMMPVVSQVLGGSGAHPVGTNSGESRLQPPHNDKRVGDTLDGRSSQIDLHQACQCIELHDSPEDIFSAVLETAAQAYGEDESIQGMLEELVGDPELTNDYLKLLLQQVHQRIQSESQSRNQS